MPGLLTRGDFEARERETLSPFAALSAESLGRLYPEDEHDNRTAFQRDRDRLVHCTAFRRLEYKTQVFINKAGDHYRTRLTHTLEVGQIARTLARLLGMNEDLTEAIALAHDVGHPPFGHAGERVLDGLMQAHGGFEHNAQALRIVDALESRYPDWPGLNLTAETRRSILKRKPPYPGMGQGLPKHLTIEAQIVDLSDEISYGSHDLDDGIDSGLLTFEEVLEVPLWSKALETVNQKFPDLDDKRKRFRLITELINKQVNDAARQTSQNLQQASDDPVTWRVDFSPAMKEELQATKAFLFSRLYRHPLVLRNNTRCEMIVSGLFEHYCANPGQLRGSFRQRIESEGLERTVADYISGMTDRYAEADYRQLFGF